MLRRINGAAPMASAWFSAGTPSPLSHQGRGLFMHWRVGGECPLLPLWGCVEVRARGPGPGGVLSCTLAHAIPFSARRTGKESVDPRSDIAAAKIISVYRNIGVDVAATPLTRACLCWKRERFSFHDASGAGNYYRIRRGCRIVIRDAHWWIVAARSYPGAGTTCDNYELYV